MYVVRKEESRSRADRRERQPVGVAEAVVPCDATVDKAVKLIPGKICTIQFLIKAQLNRSGCAVVPADLGGTISATEGRATEIELLREEKRS